MSLINRSQLWNRLLRPNWWLAINLGLCALATAAFVALHGLPTPYTAIVHVLPISAAALGAIILHHLAREGTRADSHWPLTPSRTRSVWLIWPIAAAVAFAPSLAFASAWIGAVAVFSVPAFLWSAAVCCAAAASTARLGTEPHCAKCEYPAPLKITANTVCPECAAPLSTKDALALGKHQSSPSLKVVSSILVYVVIGAFLLMSATRGAITSRLLAALPTPTLINVALEDPFSEAPWSALSTRALTSAQKELLLERMTEIESLARAGDRFLTALTANPAAESPRFRELLVRFALRSERDRRYQFDLYRSADHAAIPPSLVPDVLRNEWCASAFSFVHSQARAPEEPHRIRVNVSGSIKYGRGGPDFEAYVAIEAVHLDGQVIPLPVPKPVMFARITSKGIALDPFDLPEFANAGRVRRGELTVTLRAVRTNQNTRLTAPDLDRSKADTETPIHLFTPAGEPIPPAWAMWSRPIEVKGPVTLGGWTRPPNFNLR